MDPEPGEEAFRSLQGQSFGILYDTADLVRQTAVGVGNVSGTFKYQDLCLFIQSADSCCCGGTSGHTAYDDNFHTDSTFPR